MSISTVYPESRTYGTAITDLDDNRKTTADLLEIITDPSSGAIIPERVIRLLRAELSALDGELERRYSRIDRLIEDPLHIDVLRDRAAALQAMLPIHQYIGCERMSVELTRNGRRFHGRCPYPDHQEDEGSFTIFAGDFAWCDGCDRGGNLFAVIGLCEGLESPLEQVKRAAQIVGYTIDPEQSHRSQDRSFPTNSHREKVGKERFGRGKTFKPIRIVNGQVAS